MQESAFSYEDLLSNMMGGGFNVSKSNGITKAILIRPPITARSLSGSSGIIPQRPAQTGFALNFRRIRRTGIQWQHGHDTNRLIPQTLMRSRRVVIVLVFPNSKRTSRRRIKKRLERSLLHRLRRNEPSQRTPLHQRLLRHGRQTSALRHGRQRQKRVGEIRRGTSQAQRAPPRM